MSAWIVSKRHIDLLVEALYRYEVATPADRTPDDIGQALWDENYKSINYRYEENDHAPQYRHTSQGVRRRVRSPSLVFKQIHCYTYQSSEHPECEGSFAHWVMHELEKAVLGSLGMTAEEAYKAPAWDKDPWGID